MKNRIKLIVMLSVITIVAALFSGCFLTNFGEVKTISLVGTPKNVYYMGEAFDASGAQIKIEYKNDQQQSEIVEIKSVEDGGLFNITFSTETEGTYKCVITLAKNENISLSFDYSVKGSNSKFTEGDGSQGSPYVVYTAEQFSHIGDEIGKYYVLGDNIDFTKATPKNGSFYNTNKNSFVLDGQGCALTIGGFEKYAFNKLTNSVIKNLTFNIKPGSVETLLALFVAGKEVVIDNVTFNGSMEAEQNDGLIAAYLQSKKTTVKNCTNNVNITSTSTYYGAFLGLAFNNAETVTFENCVNNGNLEGSTAWIFIGNNASQIKEEINVINCRNNGRLVGSSVGLFNCSGIETVGARMNKEAYDATTLKTKIKECSVNSNASDFVAIPNYKSNGKSGDAYLDLTLVKKDGKVQFADDVKTKLNAEFGENGYTVKAFVRDWVKWESNGDNKTIYVFTNNYGLDFNAPYKLIENTENVAEKVNGALIIEGEKITLSGMYKNLLYKTQKEGEYQFYCYYIYDANDSLRYCGQIQYKNVQNA